METRQNIRVTQSQRLQLNLGLQASIRVLKADAEGLTRYLEEQAAENPHLLLHPARPEAGDWLPRWESALGGGGLDPDLAASAGPSLMAHVVERIAAMGLRGDALRVAELLAEALEPAGWLGRSLTEIAAEAGVPVAQVEQVLRRLQSIEPAGLFARSLSECLLLQAVEAGQDSPVLRGVLENLPLMATGDAERLARALGVAVDAVQDCFRTIRRFDPKPGAQFSAFSAPVREPDIVARRHVEGWVVSLNRSSLPAMSVSAGRGGGRGAARAVIRLVESRNATLLRVGTEVLRRQEAALDHGLAALVPLTMTEVAEGLGLHESTVSRIVAGTSVDTPKGTLWLRNLFSGRIGSGTLSAAAVRAKLADLVNAEDRRAPLTDEALAAVLSGEGAAIARRTVAKYREMLGLPPAHRRRILR
ncbi:RNA polymerase factor sigma-54 [Paragemmobacter straminiformis]|uniref:RNA polymerase sigma-54 factor n=1 Tax=Paragemmobacter straminiformis TaxID=2045119 RepID=A0A842I370_9RHOB|nr:RNA polymerase factor sigma-54 [Gemmobacter straminiformis]MBC2834622.1 RNA polymerase factor sigma-54 [Gemmobacter straminiformis]